MSTVQTEGLVMPGAAAFVRVKHPCHAVLGSFRSDSDGGRAIRVPGHYLIEPWVSGSGTYAKLVTIPRPLLWEWARSSSDQAEDGWAASEVDGVWYLSRPLPHVMAEPRNIIHHVHLDMLRASSGDT